MAPDISIGDDELRAFVRATTSGASDCSARLGAALRGELRPDSDLDLLVEFEPGRVPGLLTIAQLEIDAIVGREVEFGRPAI